MYRIRTTLLCALLLCISTVRAGDRDSTDRAVDAYLSRTMREAKIPGLSVVLIDGDRQRIISYGYADRARGLKVTPRTLFQLASCSKAFTALAVRMLEGEGKLRLDDDVQRYLPWFAMKYKDKPEPITIEQLLHHSSGISWNSMSVLEQSDDAGALQRSIRRLTKEELANPPGKKYEYATINYDVLALVVERVTGQSFEDYIQSTLLPRIGLEATSIGHPGAPALMAQGYKIGFLRPRAYDAPPYRANDAAGYIISNAEDMARWLRVQLGRGDTSLNRLVQLNHQRDETVAASYDLFSYAEGWMVSLRGDGEIYHSGLNPSFTSFVGFRPGRGLGVVVLANSSSGYTEMIGHDLLKILAGHELEKDYVTADGNDKSYTIVSGILAIYLLVALAFGSYTVWEIAKKRRRFAGFGNGKMRRVLLSLLACIPFLTGIYLLPRALVGLDWAATLVWSPVSFVAMLTLVLASLAASYGVYFLGLFYPQQSKFRRVAPGILVMSILSGIANMIVILLVTSALNSQVKLGYLLFYYALTLSVYLFARWFVQIHLMRLSNELIYDLRVKLIDKIFTTSYQKFENIPGGRVYAALNDDVQTIGEAANMFVMLIVNLFTIVGAFLFLASIALWATLLTVFMVLSLSTMYYLVSRRANAFFEQARDTREHFINLMNGMVEGFKELSLRRGKRQGYKTDITDSAAQYRSRITVASTRFINASVIGESVLILILGVVAFALQRIFPQIRTSTLTSFIVVLLYLIGPLNAVLNSIPSILRIRIAWTRVQQFLASIPANLTMQDLRPVSLPPRVESIRLEDVLFTYRAGRGDHPFTVGPVNLEVKRGEILFIIGGNGSGKTTLSKLITGLYEPDGGRLLINGRAVHPAEAGEYFSAVFSPVYLFEKLYDIDVKGSENEIIRYLQLLHLDGKVAVSGEGYSTLKLSSGQRKRLALLQCYLEDAPILLFDEWAADQDPEYRHFFYRHLLPEMKRQGKIVIAITHDDNYFDTADAVVKMKNGQLEEYAPVYHEGGAASVITNK